MTPPASSGPQGPSDEFLMAELAGGKVVALDALMLRWQRPLHDFLRRHLGHEADALDLAQESFVRVYRHRADYRVGARFSTWLFQIALNLARDHARKRSRRRTDSLEAADPAWAATLAHPGEDPACAARRAEERAAVRRALDDLPDDLRALVVLAEFEERTHADIATLLDTTPKAVESRLARARARLRHTLAAWLRESSRN